MKINNKNIHPGVAFGSIIAIAVIVVGAVWFYAGDNGFSFRDIMSNGDENGNEEVVSDSGNIAVTSPSPGDSVGLPLVVEGRARVFENSVSLRVRDADGSVLVEDFTTANAPDIGEFGSFRAELFYPEPEGSEGTLEVYSVSARDGSEIDKVEISIVFEEVDALTVEVYFTTSETGVVTCEATEFVERRIPRTQAVGRAALEQLLKGPTVNERSDGFSTSINPGTELQSLRIENGTAFADFNEMLDFNIGGSCMVTSIFTQIENTLLQFDTINDVVISIDGETEEVLQP